MEFPALFESIALIETVLEGGNDGTREEHTAEQVVGLLRQIGAAAANGKAGSASRVQGVGGQMCTI